MPIMKRGHPPAAIRYVDAHGIEHQVVQVRVGERIVWDGTTPAFVYLGRATAAAGGRPLTVSAGQSINLGAAAAVAEGKTVTVRGGAAPRLLPAAAAAAAGVVDLTAGASVELLAAEAEAAGTTVSAGEASPGAVLLERATAAAAGGQLVVSIPATVELTTATSVAEGHPITVAGHAAAEVLAAVADADGGEVTITAGQSLAMSRAQAQATGGQVSASAGHVISMGAAAATAAGGLVTVRTFVPMGAYMTELYDGWSNNSWNPIWPIAALPGYSGTVLTGASGTGAGVVVSAGTATIIGRVTYGSTRSSGQQARLVKNGSTVLETGTAVDTEAANVTWTGTLAADDIVRLEFAGDSRGSSSRKINGGQTATYLTINPA